MKSTNVPHGEIIAAEQRIWAAIGDDADKVVARINVDPEYVEKVAKIMVEGGDSISQQAARKIMGSNYFGVEEAARYFGVEPTRGQIDALAEVPFSSEVLRSCRSTHVLVAIFPLSIAEILRDHMVRSSRVPLFSEQLWYHGEQFTFDRGDVGWKLVRKGPIAGSAAKTWDGQLALLSKDEVTLSAQVLVYTIIGHFLATGERLLECFYGLCNTTHSVDSCHIRVGFFDSKGLKIYYWEDGRADSCVGLAAARKR